MIVSQPVYADSGSETCRFQFTGSPTVTVVTTNASNGGTDQCTVNVSGVTGTCPCGGRATIEYAYFLTIPGLGSGGLGWTSSSGVYVNTNPIWPNSGGSVTVGVGVRVTCVTNAKRSIRCRFGTATYTIGKNQSLTRSFSLSSNNGNSTPPTGIPACDGAALQARSLSEGGLLVVVAGFQAPIALEDAASDQGVEIVTDLGPVEVPATTTSEPSSATAPSATTTISPNPTNTVPPATTTSPSPDG